MEYAWCAVGVGTCTCNLPATVTVSGGGSFCGTATITASGGSGGTIYFQGTTSNGTSTANLSAVQTIAVSGTYYFRSKNICGWGPQGSVTVTIISTPTTQGTISSIVFNSSSNSIQVNMVPGNGARRILKMNTTNSFAVPANGTDPIANANYSGSGEQVVYNGNGNTVTITGVLPAIGYCFRLYEANCSGIQSLYNLSIANNPLCLSSAALPPDLTCSQFLSTTQITNGAVIDEVIVVRNVGVGPTTAPITFSITNYNPLTGLTVTSSTANNLIIGIDNFILDNSNWTFNSSLGTFTSNAGVTINPGAAKNIGIRITRSGGANGTVTQTATITSGTGGGELTLSNNSISNSILKY